MNMRREYLEGNSLKLVLRKISFNIFVVFSLAFFLGCSSDDDNDDGEIPIDPIAPFSVDVSNSNKNMPSGGIITSEFSDSPSGSNIGKIVDGNVYTKFITNHTKFYILWEGSRNVVLNFYSLTSANDSPEKDPKSWSLYGSDNKENWTLLDSRKDQTFTERIRKNEYQVDNVVSYKYYKLEIENNNGGESTQIAEWVIREFPTDYNDLMKYAEGNSYSPSTPMGNHYANRHVTTPEDVQWLSIAENEPPAPDHVSHLRLTYIKVDLYPFGTPQPADVNQHSIGDCSALAIFASMAYIYPDFVKSLIKDNGDETFTVSMFDPQGKPVKVKVTSNFLVDDNGNIQAASGKYNKATWATVLEKAIMKYNCIYKVNPDIGGIGSEHVAPLFTGDGNSFAFYPGKLNAADLARVAEVSLTQGKIIVGGFNVGGLKVDGGETVTAHAFTLMHSSNSNALFTMRNPWGGEKDGILNILDDGVVPQTIDFRIIDPGIAKNFGDGAFTPYIPPKFSVEQNRMRVAEYLLNPETRVFKNN